MRTSHSPHWSTRRHSLPLLLISFLILLNGCLFQPVGFRSHAQKAEELRKRGQYDEAVEEYRLHMKERLGTKNRLPDENPSFYYVLMGDTYLEADDVKKAEEYYEKAREDQIESELISDRVRGIADYYRKKADYSETFRVLKKYRDLDPLMFDLVIDEVHREQVAKDEAGAR